MQISYFKQILILIISGLLMGLSFPHSGSLFLLAFIVFAPLIWFNVSINSFRKFRTLKRFFGNYSFMLVYNYTATWWIVNASFEGGMMAFFANSFLMTLPFFFFGFITRRLGENKGLISLVALWLGFEHIHHIWDLSWPWLSFGNIFGDQVKLIQWYEYSGIQGGTLWVLLVNILIYIIFRNIWIKKESLKIQTPNLIFLTIVLIFPILSSLFIYYNYSEKKHPIEVVIVQPNMHPWNKDFTAAGPKFTTPVSQQISNMLEMVESVITDSTAFVLFPETAIASYTNENTLDNMGVVFKLRKFSKNHHNIPLFIGADTYGLFDEERQFPAMKRNGKWLENYNTALLIDSKNPINIYHKAKLVLGVEKLPFVNIFPFIKQLSVDLGGTNGILVGNKEPKLFKPNHINSAPLICYESVYGEYVSRFTRIGAEILCVITNDGWWGDTPGYKQHLIFSKIRAIENRRSLVRSANTGISCFINQKGEIIEQLDWDKKGVLKNSINKNLEFTFYVKYGDLLGRVALFLVIAMFLMAIINLLKSKGVQLNKRMD